MYVSTFANALWNLQDVMDRVVEDRTPVMVMRPQGEAVVMVSLTDWHAMQAARPSSQPTPSARPKPSLAPSPGPTDAAGPAGA